MRRLIVGFACLLPVIGPAAVTPAARGQEMELGLARVDITPDYPVRLHGYGLRSKESVRRRAADLGQGAGDRLRRRGPEGPRLGRQPGRPRRHRRGGRRPAEAPGPDSSRSVRRGLLAHPQRPVPDGRRAQHLRQAHPDERAGGHRPLHPRADRQARGVALAALKAPPAGAARLGPGHGRLRGQPPDEGGPGRSRCRSSGDRPRRQAPRRRGQLCLPLHDARPADNKISGDWAGFAQEAIEPDHPGAIALTVIGCGADANPAPRVDPGDRGRARPRRSPTRSTACSAGPWTPPGVPPGRAVPTGQASLRHAADPRGARGAGQGQAGTPGYNAVSPARAGSTAASRSRPSSTIRSRPGTSATGWPWSSWPARSSSTTSCGSRRELDAGRLWVDGLRQRRPLLHPLRAILSEGGYEGGGAMVYYARPTRLEAGARGADHRRPSARLVPPGVPASPSRADDEMPPPKSPGRVAAVDPDQAGPARRAGRRRAAGRRPGRDRLRGRRQALGLRDARLPDRRSTATGSPAGVIKVLEDTDGDGRYDTATVFLDGLPFPTGVMAWRKGVLVCAAPTSSTPRTPTATARPTCAEVLFSGFATENYQARVNGLSYGLDNWVYGANGLIGGTITGLSDRPRGRHRRPRLPHSSPTRATMEPAAGPDPAGPRPRRLGQLVRRQQQRSGSSTTRCPTTTPAATRTSPRPAPAVYVPRDPDSRPALPGQPDARPVQRPRERQPRHLGVRPGIYRDTLLGDGYAGNAFICEPVHNLVHREVLSPDGVTLRRPPRRGRAGVRVPRLDRQLVPPGPGPDRARTGRSGSWTCTAS